MFDVLFAWSWGGHGELTTFGAAIAIARLVSTAKPEYLQKLYAFARSLREGIPIKYLPGAKAIEAGISANQQTSITETERELAALLRALPRKVQTEDLHRGNIPYVGQYLQGDSQVRHFMRSDEATSGIVAYTKSRAYIREHLMSAFSELSKAMNNSNHWYSNPLNSFIEGLDDLSAALHTLQDSYAPGHVTRLETVFWITEIHIWDKENRDGDPSRAIPTHEEYDDPQTLKSVPFFKEAQKTTANFIYSIFANLDESQDDFAKVIDPLLESSLSVVLTSKMY
jgi:hypothetical protein